MSREEKRASRVDETVTPELVLVVKACPERSRKELRACPCWKTLFCKEQKAESAEERRRRQKCKTRDEKGEIL